MSRSNEVPLNWRPDHAYLPGKNTRHPEGVFDPIKSQVPTEITFETILESTPYLVGLELAKDGFFWETHEVLEPIWMAAAESSNEKLHIQALIQLANAGLKKKLGWGKAFDRLCVQADDLHARVIREQGVSVTAIQNYERLKAQIIQN